MSEAPLYNCIYFCFSQASFKPHVFIKYLLCEMGVLCPGIAGSLQSTVGFPAPGSAILQEFCPLGWHWLAQQVQQWNGPGRIRKWVPALTPSCTTAPSNWQCIHPILIFSIPVGEDWDKREGKWGAWSEGSPAFMAKCQVVQESYN